MAGDGPSGWDPDRYDGDHAFVYEYGEDGLRSWLAMFGDELLAPVAGEERESVLAAVEDRLRPDLFRDGAWVADYRRLRFSAVRT